MCTSRILRMTRYAVAVAFCSLVWKSQLCAQGDVSFIARRDFRVQGIVVAVGDFNGDRYQDLVTAHGSTVSVLLADRDGRFKAGKDVPVGGAPSAVTVGDFNGDGRQDLATANGDAGTVSVLLGRGDGSFRVARNYRVGGPANSIAVGDFNKDGRQDLATANGDSGTVSVLLGRSDGTFGARTFQVGGAPSLLTVGDFNGDGRHDLAVANSGPNTISVLLGKGNGTFQLAVDTDLGVPPSSIAAADFNGDGREDLAVSGWGCDENNDCVGTTSILLATGNGTFQVSASYSGGFDVKTGDFNGDGHQDLGVAWGYEYDCCPGHYGLQILLGQGDGTFLSASGWDWWYSPFAFGDFDADGRQDLAIGNIFADTISILRGHGDGSFEDAINLGIGAHVVRVGDLNGDGHQDLAMTNFRGRCNEGGCDGEEAVSVLLGRGDGTFEAAQQYSRGCPFGIGTCPADFAIGDFNGDGRQDLVLFSGNSVSIQLSKGDGTFQEPKSFTVAGTPASGRVGDFNGDGRQDLAIANSSGFGLLGSISIFLGKGDGTFQVASVLARGPGPMAVGDFNGDGHQDLATANTQSNTVSVLLGKGNGTFQVAGNLVVGQGPAFVTVGDFNADGRQDLAAANGGGTVSILLGKEDGTFQPAREFTVGHGIGSLSVADFNADGHQDLAADLSIFLGRGDGTFESAKEFGVNGDFSSVAVGDFNGDGLPDLVTNTVSILINNSALKVPINILHEKINPKSHGSISMAILTTDSFDATTVDTTTVRFGANGTEAAPARVDLRDVDHDGDIDMLLSFETQQTGIRCGYTAATLQGKTLTGQFIRGSDFFETVGCP